METNHKKALADLGYTLSSTLVKDHEWSSDRMADWTCILTGPNGKSMTVEYHTGKAHREIYRKRLPFRATYSEWCMSKASKPDLADLVSCLVIDSQASDQSFADWCSDLGYDTDSRKALDTYLACQKIGSDLGSIGANISDLSELLADY